MHFTIDQQDTTTIFRLKESRLDSANASALKAEFLILAQPDVESLIVDLTEVTYVDSAGLSALLLAQRQQSAHAGDVRLVGVSESVKSLLRLTQLDRVFPQYQTLEEAMNAESFLDGDGLPEATKAGAGLSAAKVGALAVGGSLGAAALAAIMMGHAEDPDMLAGDEDDDFDDDDFEDDDFDDDEEDAEGLDDEDDDEDDFEEEEAEPADVDLEKEVIDDLDDDLDDDDDDDFDDEDDIL